MKKKERQLLIPIVVAIATFVITVGMRFYQLNIDHQVKAAQITLSKRKSDLTSEQNRYKQLTEYLANDGNRNKSVATSNAQQIAAQKQVAIAADKLFSVMMTYHSQKEWNAQPKKLRNLVAENVLKDKHIFHSDKDSTGNSFINGQQLVSQYQSCDVVSQNVQGNGDIRAIVLVKYSSSSYNKKPSDLGDYYTITYNVQEKKITGIQYFANKYVRRGY